MAGTPRVPGGRTTATESWWETIDPVATVRGGSRGFTVLLLGGLAHPVVLTAIPPVGSVWLVLTAVTAFVVAAWRPGSSARCWLSGTVSALIAYLLILPLVLLQSSAADMVQIGLTSGTAILVGAVSGWLRGVRMAACERGRRG